MTKKEELLDDIIKWLIEKRKEANTRRKKCGIINNKNGYNYWAGREDTISDIQMLITEKYFEK